ncbi:multidrug transporter [Frateuria sp. Soil773]|uniref:M16 family metallopeptidase n=1 Tax=Frateuria sp. Soil773 TaxID=1736407 RepID=UPI000700E157|nr:pitrilysin family protein [Frateuria sp. Soil773]KRE97650.1 multidrug transporter [Frateuria sp. Soil773]
MKTFRLAALAAALLAAGHALAAEADFPATPPAPGPAPKLTVPAPAVETLANGLQVVSVRRDGLPLVTAELLLRRGGELDPAGKAGLADLTATLLTKGAAGLGAPQIAAAAETLGGSLDASAGWDQSTLGITVTTPKLPAALALLAKVARQPAFSEDEIKRARAQALDELHLTLSQPTSLASLAAARATFGDGAYGHPRGGTPASLAAISRADLQRMHATIYRPDNAVLILTGDIAPAQAKALAQQSFGDWMPPATPLAAAPAGKGEGRLPPVLLIDQHGAGQAGVVAAHASPPRSDADYYTGAVANAVLGGSYSARLNEEIRIKRGLSYGANSRLEGRRDSGLWLATAQTKNPSAAQVVELMQGEFARLGDTPVPEAELAARKATLIGGYGRSLETTAGLAAQVGALATYGVDLAEIGRYIERVQAVTPAQVQHYAAGHLDRAGTHVVVAGDAAQFAPAIRKAHPQAQVLPMDALDLDRADLRAPSGAAKPAAH